MSTTAIRLKGRDIGYARRPEVIIISDIQHVRIHHTLVSCTRVHEVRQLFIREQHALANTCWLLQAGQASAVSSGRSVAPGLQAAACRAHLLICTCKPVGMWTFLSPTQLYSQIVDGPTSRKIGILWWVPAFLISYERQDSSQSGKGFVNAIIQGHPLLMTFLASRLCINALAFCY